MSRSGVNMAVTTDGAAYNKLRRPDVFTPFKSSPGESSKRKHDEADMTDSSSDGEIYDYRPKEKRMKSTMSFQKPLSTDPHRIPRPVRENGMQIMFPGLDGDEDPEDETMQEALAYLRSVRSEASTIPTLLVAEPEINEDEEDRTMYNHGRGDYRACFVDGTWVAVNDPSYSDDQGSYLSEDLDPQECYYKSLLSRYRKLQHQLMNADPKKLAALRQANPSQYTELNLPSRRNGWLHTFEHEYPTPMLAHEISELNLFWALEFAGESLGHYDTISRQKSCWIWTLLALVGDRGTLDHTKIGRIRELGRRAGQFGVFLREDSRRSLLEESEDDEVEEWVVDGAGTDGEENEDEAEETTEPFALDKTSMNRDSQETGDDSPQVEPGPNVALAETGMDRQLDGAEDSAANDSASDDEGEIKEDSPENEVSELDAARASLLAQLGDRLVQPSVPPSPGYLQHKHNGKRCHDSQCRTLKQLLEAHTKNNSLPKQNTTTSTVSAPAPPKQVFASRAEAEAQRQKMREHELQRLNAAASNSSLLSKNTQVAPTPSPQPEDQAESSKAGASLRNSASANAEMDEDNEDTDPIDLNTRVTIDMILTIVAECYGQKDLLRYREVW